MRTVRDIAESLTEINESLSLIAKELEWILSICNEKKPLPDTPLGDEMIQKFMSLFKDFNGITLKLNKIENEIFSCPNELTKCRLELTIALLYQRIHTGLFAQFRSVATTGELPSIDDEA